MNKAALCAAAALAAMLAVAAHAGSGSTNDDGQQPPVAQEKARENAQDNPPSVQDGTPPAPPKQCLTDKSGFRNRDGQNEFYVELINACDKALVCVVKAYVIGAEGGKAGSGTVQLAPALDGKDVHETWTMSTAQNGGMASVSRSCTFV